MGQAHQNPSLSREVSPLTLWEPWEGTLPRVWKEQVHNSEGMENQGQMSLPSPGPDAGPKSIQ